MNKTRRAGRVPPLERPRASSRIEFNIEENTRSQPAPEHHDPFDPGSLLISDDFAWESVVETSSAMFCGNVPVRGIEKATGRNVAYPVRCKTLFHQPCAEAKVMGKLRLLSFAAHKAPTWHFAVVETSNLGRNLLADRRYRREKKLGRPVRYMRVDRVGGVTFIFASDPLTGRKEPTVFYPAVDLLRLAAGVMSLPGVARIHTSRWGLDDDHDDADDDVAYLGFAGDARYRLVERMAAKIAKKRHGVDVALLAPTRLEGGLTPEQWIECMKTAWDQARFSEPGG